MKNYSTNNFFVILTLLLLVSSSSNLSAQSNTVFLRPQSWDSLYLQAKFNQEKGNLNQAIFQYDQLINFNIDEVDEHQIQCETNLGKIFLSRGEYLKAYQHFERAYHLTIDHQLGNQLAAKVLLEASFLMSEAGLDSLASINLEVAKEIVDKEKNQSLMIDFLNTEGHNHFIANRDDASEKAFRKAVDLATEANEQTALAIAKFGIGKLLFKIDQNSNATPDFSNYGRNYFEASIVLAQSLDDKATLAQSQVFLGEIYIKNNSIDTAYRLCNQAYEVASISNMLKTRLLSCNCLKQIHTIREEWQFAFQIQEEENQLKEKLDENLLPQQLSSLRFKEALTSLKEQQAYEREQLETKKTWADELVSLQKSRILILSTLFGVSLLFVLILYRLFSAKKQHNTELQTLNYHLNSSNNMLETSVEELNQTNETLLQTNRALNNFATVAAHDLKGPLRSIISFSQLLQRSLGDKIGANEKDYFEYINTNTRKLATLIDDLLNFSSLGRQMPSPVNVDLNDVTKDVIASLQQTIEDQNTEFYINKLPIVLANYSLMIQVFQNIISNSLKFAQEERKSIITINAFSLSAERVQISIQDNGIGIPEKEQAQVFELFTRLNPQDKYEGSGVGLATCRKIVRYYGGKMMISSTEGEGTTVFFDLPLVSEKSDLFHVITINES